MDKLTIYADPKTPEQRAYQLDEKIANEAFFDMLNSFKGNAFQNDLGIEAPGEKPKHNIPAQLQAIDGVGMIAFASPCYTVFKRKDASWDVLDPKIQEILAQAFGEIGQVDIIEGSLK